MPPLLRGLGTLKWEIPKGWSTGPSPPLSVGGGIGPPSPLYSGGEFPGPQVVICGIEVDGLLESPRPGHPCKFSELRYINQQGARLALGPVTRVEPSDMSPSQQISHLWFPVPCLNSLLFGIEMYFLHHNVHSFKMYNSVTTVYS